MNKKLQQEFIDRMKKCIENNDGEEAHQDADDLLCELLKKLGYKELIDIYLDVEKWYA